MLFYMLRGQRMTVLADKGVKWLQNTIYFMFILQQDCTQGIYPGIPTLQEEVLT